jgi:hypothetical protein
MDANNRNGQPIAPKLSKQQIEVSLIRSFIPTQIHFGTPSCH